MSNKTIFGVLAVLVAIGVGYWVYSSQSAAPAPDMNQMGSVNSGENAEPGSAVHDLPVEPAAAAARADLAGKLGVDERSIVIMLVEERTWSDGCLGLGGPAESCIAALVDGFRVEMEANGKTYMYRTDKAGASVRAEAN
jgi:hypothetical protein